jgi:hypothetical protein
MAGKKSHTADLNGQDKAHSILYATSISVPFIREIFA